MVAVYPAELPQSPLLDGLEFTREPNSINFEVEVGEGKGRRRFTGQRRTFPFQIIVTQAQREIWDTFYDDTLADGTQLFFWTDPYTGETGVTFKFVNDSAPTITPLPPGKWKISTTVRRVF